MSGININASDFLLDGALDPRKVTLDVDFNPGTLNGDQLILCCYQYKRTWNPLTWFGRGALSNWIYTVGNSRYLVYKPFPLDRVVTIMGFSRMSMSWDKNSVPMETYASYIIDNTAPAWMQRNNFVRVNPNGIPLP